MYERMLDKAHEPTEDEITRYIGKTAQNRIELLKTNLEKTFAVKYELKYPFGANYGWGIKVSKGTKHLFYIFFEKGSITVTIQLSGIENEYAKVKYNEVSDEGKEYWKNKYPCGENGGWIHFRVLSKTDMKDIGQYIMIKVNKDIEWEV
jgi:hypothetical protein